MALLKVKEKEKKVIEPFDYAKVRGNIITWAQDNGFLVLNAAGLRVDTDLLLVRSVTREVKITINSLNPYSRHEEQTFQQVFWVCIGAPEEIIEPDTDEKYTKNQSALIMVSSLDQLKSRINDF